MFRKPDDFLLDSPFSGAMSDHYDEVAKMADAHEKMRKSPEYEREFLFLRRTLRDLTISLRLCMIAATRWNTFHERYLLPAYVEDIVEAALVVEMAVENGALAPAHRELRYMLEVAVNIAYVDERKATETFDDRIKYYRSKDVNKANVDHVFDLPLRLLGLHKASFSKAVLNAWVKGSNYVHLTKRRVDEKLLLRQQGISIGFETIDMMKQVVADVHEVCSFVLILTFETIGPSFTGDVFIDGRLDDASQWAFHASEYVAIVNSSFDYKHERQDKLHEIVERRNKRVRFPAIPP